MSKKNLGMLQMAACAALWSIAGVFIKKIGVSPIIIAGMRSLFAAVCTFLYMKFAGIKFTVNKRVFAGSIFTAATFLLFVSSNKLTDAANAIVLQYTEPIFLLIFASIIFKEKMKKRDIIVSFVTLIGIALFFADNISGEKFFGNFVAIGAGITLAMVYLIYSHVTVEERISGMFIGHIITGIVGGTFYLIKPEVITAIDFLYMGILGVFQLGIAYIFFCLAVGNASGFACSVIGAIEPLLNPLLVMIFLGEKPGKFALIGSVVVISAVTVWCVIDAKHDAMDKNKTAVS